MTDDHGGVLTIGNDPALGHNIPDGEVVIGKLEVNSLCHSGVEVDALKVSKDPGRLSRGVGEGNVQLRNLAAIDIPNVGDIGCDFPLGKVKSNVSCNADVNWTYAFLAERPISGSSSSSSFQWVSGCSSRGQMLMFEYENLV
jgi:hypothetical protein